MIYEIRYSFSLITGCLEMKRGTVQSGRMWDNKETFSIRNGIIHINGKYLKLNKPAFLIPVYLLDKKQA